MFVNFIRYSKIYFLFSVILLGGSLACLFIYGLNFGIEFTGGSILEVEYKETRPANQEIRAKLADLDLGAISVQTSAEKGIIIRMKSIDENIHQDILTRLKESNEMEEKRFEMVGPVIGKEIKEKTKIVIAFSLAIVVLYVAFAFRGVQRPLRSWQYGIATLVALFHDVLIPLGALSILGEFYGVQITIPIIVALLTIIGYAVNNVVVVFDRIRENILIQRKIISFDELVNTALNQTITRCVNTALTTLAVLFAIFFFGGETLKYFSLTLIIGVSAGLFSSLFLASPLLVVWHEWKQGKKFQKKRDV